MNKPRIELSDTGLDVIMKMSGGNIGAVTCLTDVMKYGAQIDPDNVLGPLGTILTLDSFEIYDQYIYVLWSDHCNRDARSFIAAIRACQMGNIPVSRLRELSKTRTYGETFTEEELETIEASVSELPNFQKKEAEQG